MSLIEESWFIFTSSTGWVHTPICGRAFHQQAARSTHTCLSSPRTQTWNRLHRTNRDGVDRAEEGPGHTSSSIAADLTCHRPDDTCLSCSPRTHHSPSSGAAKGDRRDACTKVGHPNGISADWTYHRSCKACSCSPRTHHSPSSGAAKWECRDACTKVGDPNGISADWTYHRP